MPTPCYISITGQTQGNITAGAFTADSVGNIYVQGHEDEMLVQEFLHNVTVPTDPQSGQPAGHGRWRLPETSAVTASRRMRTMSTATMNTAGWRRRRTASRKG
ncbi:Hcp-like protein [Escherichia coli]|nr:Hcp-like protein [Escherichia coli]